VAHHGAGLRLQLELAGYSREEAVAKVHGLTADYTAIVLEPSDRAALDFAAKLTREPLRMSGEDVDRLRAAGFDDRAIHDICVIAAYYAFVNRIADGLGVELEPRFAS